MPTREKAVEVALHQPKTALALVQARPESEGGFARKPPAPLPETVAKTFAKLAEGQYAPVGVISVGADPKPARQAASAAVREWGRSARVEGLEGFIALSRRSAEDSRITLWVGLDTERAQRVEARKQERQAAKK